MYPEISFFLRNLVIIIAQKHGFINYFSTHRLNNTSTNCCIFGNHVLFNSASSSTSALKDKSSRKEKGKKVTWCSCWKTNSWQ